MQKNYIKQVKRALRAPGKRKREIIRDLDELFAAAHEHGDGEAALIERLGTPEEFARDMEAQLGITVKRRRNTAIAAAILAVIAAAALIIRAVARTERPTEGVIGGADSMTSILVVSRTGPDMGDALLMLAIAAAVAAAALMLLRHRAK